MTNIWGKMTNILWELWVTCRCLGQTTERFMDKLDNHIDEAKPQQTNTQKILLKELQNMMAFFHVEQVKKQSSEQPVLQNEDNKQK